MLIEWALPWLNPPYEIATKIFPILLPRRILVRNLPKAQYEYKLVNKLKQYKLFWYHVRKK